jgi:hypothetical protein
MPDINSNSASWLESLLHGFAQFSQTAGQVLSSTFGSLAALVDLHSVYKNYRDKEQKQQRKMKLATYLSNFALNTFYVVGVLTRLASSVALSAICVGIDLITLTRVSYITHHARLAVAHTKRELENISVAYDPRNENGRFLRASHESLTLRLETERKYRFKNKVEVGFSVASVVTSALFVSGLFFPPLLVAGFGLFITVKAVQIIDSFIDNSISRWVGNLWNKITGKKKTEDCSASLEYRETLLDHSRETRKKNAVVQDRYFTHHPSAMLAGHTRFFHQQHIAPRPAMHHETHSHAFTPSYRGF